MKLLAVITVCALVGCGWEEDAQEQKRARQEWELANGIKIVRGIQYIKDPRTNLCFASNWGGMANGGPVLATVPCEAIPSEILRLAQ